MIKYLYERGYCNPCVIVRLSREMWRSNERTNEKSWLAGWMLKIKAEYFKTVKIPDYIL